MRDDFERLCDGLFVEAGEGEVVLASFAGEDTDFVRLNRGQVRQPGSITQRQLSLTLVDGARHASADIALSGLHADDLERAKASLARLREAVRVLPEDPYLLYATEVNSTVDDDDDPAAIPPAAEVVSELLEACGGLDLVGILAQGPVYRGFANTLGQRNWFSRRSLHLDFSLFHHEDKAAKSAYATTRWDEAAFSATLARARLELEALERPSRRIDPGRYRAFLSPAAMGEVMELLGWNAFGLKGQRTKQSPLLALAEGRRSLSEKVTLTEDTAGGLAPRFTDRGFIKPPSVDLVKNGRLENALVSPRSAKEYGVPTNGAGASESWASLAMAPGDLEESAVMERLGDGVYISNLWYLNYSDKKACRITGMTRFATLWVEGGVPQGPVQVMRFDESLYRMLGENLIALTRDAPLNADADTYGARSVRSSRLPGALVEDFTFTL